MDKSLVRQARRGMNRVGITVLVYYAMINLVAVCVMMVEMIVYLAKLLVNGQGLNVTAMLDHASRRLMESGWSYIVAIAIGLLIVLAWKGRGYWRREVFEKQRSMTGPDFLQLLCVFLSAQFLFQLFATFLEWLLNLVGLSAMAAVELASTTGTTFSMYLYVCILGPISEELLFRGVVMRTLRPWGKQAAIVLSALVFGLFHGNVVQIPFAFAVGMVLGYVTVEYSIFWAIVLHVFNNMIMADLLGRLPENLMIALTNGVTLAATVAAVVILICKRRQVADYIRENRMNGAAVRGFFTSPAMLIFIVVMLGMSLLTVTPL